MEISENKFYSEIKEILVNAKNKVYQTINTTMTQTYFEIGRRIVEEEQGGENRAKYGKALLKNLSIELSKEFGKGYSVDNLENMRKFFLAFSNSETLSRKFNLSWSHYVFLTRIDTKEERDFYELEAIENNWSLRELKRQFNSALYQRLALSKDKLKVEELSQKDQTIEKIDEKLFRRGRIVCE